jgi:hypothetical protein
MGYQHLEHSANVASSVTHSVTLESGVLVKSATYHGLHVSE